MRKSVLLARPHPFIVSAMKPLLEQCDYQVCLPTSLEELTREAQRHAAAVVSLAPVSSIAAPAEAVVRDLRAGNPGLTLIFASLMSFESARPALEPLAAPRVPLGVEAAQTDDQLRDGRACLYIGEDDLENGERRQLVERLLRSAIG